MRKSIAAFIAVLLVAPFIVAAEKVNPKIFIEPQDGFESYISAALVKKQTPVIVTAKKEDARFILTSAVETKEESTGSKITRCLFAYCAGMEGSQTATVRLISATTQEVVWAYNVKKGGAKNYQSTSEAVAVHLKDFIKKNPGKFDAR